MPARNEISQNLHKKKRLTGPGSAAETIVSLQVLTGTKAIQNVMPGMNNSKSLHQNSNVLNQENQNLTKLMVDARACQQECFPGQWSGIASGSAQESRQNTFGNIQQHQKNAAIAMPRLNVLSGLPSSRELPLPLWTSFNSPHGNIVRLSDPVSVFQTEDKLNALALSSYLGELNSTLRWPGARLGSVGTPFSPKSPLDIPPPNHIGGRNVNGVSVPTFSKRGHPTRYRSVRTRAHNRWGKDEDKRLLDAVKEYGVSNWKLVASMVVTRDATKCAQRWRKALRPELSSVVKGKWHIQEDEKLRGLVAKLGTDGLWNKIAEAFCFTRSPKQCRERWQNFLDPSLNTSNWTDAEDKLLLKLHTIHGSSWAQIASSFPGRTNDRVKRRVKTLLRNRKRKKEIAFAQPFLSIPLQIRKFSITAAK